MAKQNRSSMSIEEVVKSYYDTKEKFDTVSKKFDAIKKDFYSKMDDEFKENQTKLEVEYFAEAYEVTRIQKNNLEFDIGKLERSLDKETLKQVITRHYSIIDYDRFVKYLKSIGADPAKVKEFLAVTKDVDTSAIDRLAELGKIDTSVVEKAATVTKGKPYYKVKKL